MTTLRKALRRSYRTLQRVFRQDETSRSLRAIDKYMKNGRIPWSEGYHPYRWQQIVASLNSSNICDQFLNQKQLPAQYGWGLDERIVEYPWVLTRLIDRGEKRILDAGSTLNHQHLINYIAQNLTHPELSILTLAPEQTAHWQKRVSYQYADLRQIPFRDDWFDTIVCISTLEHIDFDNSLYNVDKWMTSTGDFRLAVQELRRTLRPGGWLYITVPYGQDQHINIQGSPFMQQFDRSLLNQIMDRFSADTTMLTFYKYSSSGWQLSSQDDCDEAVYFNIHEQSVIDEDHAAAARAVACIEIRKK